MSIFSKYIELRTGLKLSVDNNPTNEDQVATYNNEMIIIMDIETDELKYEGYGNKVSNSKLKTIIDDFYKIHGYSVKVSEGECLQAEFMHYIHIQNEIKDIWNGNEDDLVCCVNQAINSLSEIIPWDINHYPKMTKKLESEILKLY